MKSALKFLNCSNLLILDDVTFLLYEFNISRFLYSKLSGQVLFDDVLDEVQKLFNL